MGPSINCTLASAKKAYMTPIVTQVLVKKRQQAALREFRQEKNPEVDQHLYYKDVAGFFIFLLVVFTVLMISLYA